MLTMLGSPNSPHTRACETPETEIVQHIMNEYEKQLESALIAYFRSETDRNELCALLWSMHDNAIEDIADMQRANAQPPEESY